MYSIEVRTSFGLEALVKRQILSLGYDDLSVNDGKISLMGDSKTIAKLNINLGSADRVYIKLKEFKATDFDMLFDNIYKIERGDLISKYGNFIVNASSFKSKLHSIPAIQKISEKAIIKKLQVKYKISFFEKTSERYKIEVSINENMVFVYLDTSGDGLHKRGYRQGSVKAPIRENLAYSLVDLSFYNSERFLFDPFCGSGTILIEAARKARNIPSGIDRDFDFIKFKFFDETVFQEEKKDALSKIDFDKKLNITGCDISKKAIELAKANALNAGVEEDIKFVNSDFKNYNLNEKYGIVITNPPYGNRLSWTDLNELYENFNKKFSKLDTYSFYVITSDEKFDHIFKRKLDRKRKLYNGNIKTYYYQYYGKKPK
ncbi:MAG: class I SAM-dependent RNA methyltransferase [Peptoniphilaceae bacterium]|nr:class I SAM-dependent RNA methyltransferase [Peptoniphilaceae bacterium]MDD7383916.1 class I SAM-dependent RNA methyltransferase [Peptoniphilaceae bacterium]MDY3738059.1 class I SAM-dependent RNA methyltransferase [Peptoniphilaceae bacterium]